MASAALPVPPAMAGPVTDPLLRRAIFAARSAQAGQLNDADGAFLILVAAPLLQELLQWRQTGKLISEMTVLSSVVTFPGVAA